MRRRTRTWNYKTLPHASRVGDKRDGVHRRRSVRAKPRIANAARLTEGASQPLREGPWKGCGSCFPVNEEGQGAIDDEGQGLDSIKEH